MKSTRMKAPVLVGLCIFLMMVFAATSVYAGNNPPPFGYNYHGPAVLVDLNFRASTDDEEDEYGCLDRGVVFSGEAKCKGQTVQILDFPQNDPPSEWESFEFCVDQSFDNLSEESLENDFFVGGPHFDWLIELLPPDCLPNLKDMEDLKGLVFNVVNKYSEEPLMNPVIKKAEGVMLFITPEKAK